MKMKLNLVVLLLLLVEQQFHVGLADIFDECDGVDDGTFVASWSDCNAYVYCEGEDSVLGNCEEGQYFDNEEQSCDAAENVYCPLDDADEDEDGDGDGDEYGDYEDPDIDPEPEYPEEPEPEPTPTITTTPSANMTTTMNPIDLPPVIKDHCPIMDDPNEIVLIPNSQSCSDYYLCYHGQSIEMHCTDQLHFNTATGKCDFPEKANCLKDRPQASKCLPHMTDFFPHPDNCNYFYYCIKGFLTVQQCPFFYGWDIEKRSCVIMSQAHCYKPTKTSS